MKFDLVFYILMVMWCESSLIELNWFNWECWYIIGAHIHIHIHKKFLYENLMTLKLPNKSMACSWYLKWFDFLVTYILFWLQFVSYEMVFHIWFQNWIHFQLTINCNIIYTWFHGFISYDISVFNTSHSNHSFFISLLYQMIKSITNLFSHNFYNKQNYI